MLCIKDNWLCFRRSFSCYVLRRWLPDTSHEKTEVRGIGHYWTKDGIISLTQDRLPWILLSALECRVRYVEHLRLRNDGCLQTKCLNNNRWLNRCIFWLETFDCELSGNGKWIIKPRFLLHAFFHPPNEASDLPCLAPVAMATALTAGHSHDFFKIIFCIYTDNQKNILISTTSKFFTSKPLFQLSYPGHLACTDTFPGAANPQLVNCSSGCAQPIDFLKSHSLQNVFDARCHFEGSYNFVVSCFFRFADKFGSCSCTLYFPWQRFFAFLTRLRSATLPRSKHNTVTGSNASAGAEASSLIQVRQTGWDATWFLMRFVIFFVDILSWDLVDLI